MIQSKKKKKKKNVLVNVMYSHPSVEMDPAHL